MKTALFIVPADDPGGAEQVAALLANALALRADWMVEYRVLTSRAEPSFSLSRLSDRVQVVFGTRASPWPGLAMLPIRLWRRDMDLVFTTHLHTSATACVMRRLGLVRARRLTTRESTTIFDRFKGVKGTVARMLYATYGAQDLAITQTRYMQSHVRSRLNAAGRERLAVLENPVGLAALDRMAHEDLAPEIAERLEGRTNVLVCGRLIAVKQPGLALEAFARLVHRGEQPLQLVFVGDGPLRRDLERAAQATDMGDSVVFLGRQTNPYPIMRACHYGLLTSAREGFPNTVLEMMACGMRRIVATPCAGDLDTLDGLTVTTGFAVEDLAATLGEVITSGEDRSKTFRKAVERRSVDLYLDAVLTLAPTAECAPATPPRREAELGLIRLLDTSLALVGGLLALPVIGLAAVLVKLDSPGPAILAQPRVGRGERVFTCYKLRTMRADTPTVATHRMPPSSVTRLGRWLRRTKIDELPQLLNVLLGEMSLVGPRPCLPTQTRLIRARRLRGVYAVRPGITGRGQVMGLDMSTPVKLAEEDAAWAERPSVGDYVRLVLQTLAGRGQGDALRT